MVAGEMSLYEMLSTVQALNVRRNLGGKRFPTDAEVDAMNDEWRKAGYSWAKV